MKKLLALMLVFVLGCCFKPLTKYRGYSSRDTLRTWDSKSALNLDRTATFWLIPTTSRDSFKLIGLPTNIRDSRMLVLAFDLDHPVQIIHAGGRVFRVTLFAVRDITHGDEPARIEYELGVSEERS
jgi:hypothetical protein